ncbi:MAG: tripartite tricarboxylate transporter substrate binding protein [Proteobacteria bacterium]|nr:tripartite tricarboxylate transporter substrate binding protein [Pseudomonadota bacterium]
MWRPTRRDLVLQAGSATLLAAGGTAALAQGTGEWPTKPIRIISNFGPGGGTDNATRPFLEKVSKILGQQVLIENKGGASGSIGIEATIKSAPDGYTFLATPSLSLAIVPHVRQVSFDPFKDLAPVTMHADSMMLFAVHPSLPFNSIQDLVAYAKANPGKLGWGTAGVGSTGHILCEQFKRVAGVDILHVPYRGTGEALTDFLAGVVQINGDPPVLSHVISGRAKLLAVVAKERRSDFPNVPRLQEIYPEINVTVWFALFAPAGTPQPIIDKVAAAFNAVAREPEMKGILLNFAMIPNAGTPAQLASLLRESYDRFGRTIKEANIRAE